MTSVASALTYLHSRRPAIYHRDIKPGNITFTEDYEKVILIDFGIAVEVDDDITRTSVTMVDEAGTENYKAPEYKATFRYGPKCDVYSLGVVMAVILTSLKPRRDMEEVLSMPIDPLAGDLEVDVLIDLTQLVRQCCSVSAAGRPSSQELHSKLFQLHARCQRSINEEEQTTITKELEKSRSHFGGKGEKVGRKGTCGCCGLEDTGGLVCRNGAHFSCKSCFHEHVVENFGETDLCCRAPGCTSPPFTLDQIKDHTDDVLLAKHLEIKRQGALSLDQANVNALNLNILRQVFREEADAAIKKATKKFGNEVRKAVDDAFTPHTNRIMRSMEIIAKDEVSCPKLCFLVLPKGNRGNRGMGSMLRTLKTLSHTSVLLYFVCAYDKTPISRPLKLQKSKRWLQIVAPAVKVSIIIASLALQINTVPVQLPTPEMGLNDHLRDMDALMDDLVSTRDAELIESYVKDSMMHKKDDGGGGKYNRGSSFSVEAEATELTRAAHREIQKVATEEQDSWQHVMTIAQCKSTGEWGWVKNENEQKWINAVE
jgi:hypothetical protein